MARIKSCSLFLSCNMGSPLNLGKCFFLICLLMMLAASAQLDLFGGSSDDGLQLLSFVPLDLDSSSSTTSGLHFEDETLLASGNIDNQESLINSPLPAVDNSLFLDDNFFITPIDCPSPDLLPLIGRSKSRSRRGDTVPFCKTPSSGSDILENGDSSLPQKPTGLDSVDLFEQGVTSNRRGQNPDCARSSAEFLPYGVCSSWDPLDKSLSMFQPLPAEWGPFELWDVHHCYLSTLYLHFLSFPMSKGESVCISV